MSDRNTSEIRVGKSGKSRIIGIDNLPTSDKAIAKIDVEEAISSEIIGISYTQSSEIEKLKSEIQKILETLAENYQGVTTEIVKGEINSNPSLKQRLQSALRAGGIEALKSIFQHPGVKISIETIKGFLERQQKCS